MSCNREPSASVSTTRSELPHSGARNKSARISFASEDLLSKTLTPKRRALLKIMAGQGVMAIREIARRAERNVRAVHGDIHVLIRAGILEKVAEGGVLFPYVAIHVDFLLKAA
jgi:predicted transcriptional regulator